MVFEIVPYLSNLIKSTQFVNMKSFTNFISNNLTKPCQETKVVFCCDVIEMGENWGKLYCSGVDQPSV